MIENTIQSEVEKDGLATGLLGFETGTRVIQGRRRICKVKSIQLHFCHDDPKLGHFSESKVSFQPTDPELNPDRRDSLLELRCPV